MSGVPPQGNDHHHSHHQNQQQQNYGHGPNNRNNSSYSSPSYEEDSCPPPLRRPGLSPQQILAAAEIGFSDKYIPSNLPPQQQQQSAANGRGNYCVQRNPHMTSSDFPEIGHFSADDYGGSGADRDSDNRRQNQQTGQQEEEEGLLPPLKPPNLNDIPPDVLALLLQTPGCEDLISLQQQQQQQQQQANNIEKGRGRGNHFQQQSPQQFYQSPALGREQYQSPPPSFQQRPHHQHQQQSQERRQPPQQQQRGAFESPPRHQTQHRHQQHQHRTPNNFNNVTDRPSFRFSPDARPFVPPTPTYRPPYSEPAMSQEFSERDLAEALAQFQFQQQPPNQGGQVTSQEYGTQSSCPDDNADLVLTAVTDAITELTSHPASFSRCTRDITDALNSCTDVETLNVAVTLLMEQCIRHPNFCYSGARVAQSLVQSGVAVNNNSFKTTLLSKLQPEFLACLANMENDPQMMQRSHGILLFFGELYMNIRIEKDGVSSALHILGYGVLEMMEKLVNLPSHENIKCVFQILKLVGWELDNSGNTKMKTLFEKLLKDMSYLCMSANLKSQTKSLLDTLFDLRNKQWNHASSFEKETPESATSGYANMTPKPAAQMAYEIPDDVDYDDEDDDCILLDDEPAEVQDAYEEFLKQLQ